MFPTLFASLSTLTPRIYFGGNDVPPYFRRKCPHDVTPEQVAEEIRLVSLGRASSGYVDNDGIYLHMYEDEDEEMHIDLSREFIVIADPAIFVSMLPSAWHLLRFLQEPARRALWIEKGIAVYAEKTEQTMSLCKELDKLWQEDPFLPVLQDAVINADAREQLLPVLMRRYEERTTGESTMRWQFYDTFGPMLAKERLFLSMRAFPPEGSRSKRA